MDFSNYREDSEFRTPKQMKNNTRHTHNEMVKDRIVLIDGKIYKYKPDYAVWIEESTEEERKEPKWKEEREKDPQWIMTKKLASQLGIPIVVIDREHFAKREAEKIDILQEFIKNNGQIDEKMRGKYKECSEYFDKYDKGEISKADLVRELITKYENNRVGLQFNEKLWNKYFSQDRFEWIIESVFSCLDRISDEKEKQQILAEIAKTVKKEETKIELRGNDDNIIDEKTRAKQYYESLVARCEDEMQKIQQKNGQIKTGDKRQWTAEEVTQLIRDLIVAKDLDTQDIRDENSSFIADVNRNMKEQNMEQQK